MFKLSVTETQHYRQLVDFVVAIEQLAVERGDEELKTLVDGLRSELLELLLEHAD